MYVYIYILYNILYATLAPCPFQNSLHALAGRLKRPVLSPWPGLEVSTMPSKRLRKDWQFAPMAVSRKAAELLLAWGFPIVMFLG